ncbi:glutathione S-transferase family protein [Hydrocarboniphaga sp.]|uniref:glutathione S-transferase family protein n=1 Tax=Hydrocarboniphaga sp. TaxID=2033016 RepID=UPI003D0FCB65
MSRPELTLYALPHSYYSGKVRSYLRYKRIAYVEKVSTLREYQRLIIPRTGVKFIPVIHTADDVVVQDSTAIIDFLEARHPQTPIYPATPKQRLVALLMELYGDEWMLLPGMHYRWSFWHEKAHIRDVLEHFGLLLSPHAPRLIRRIAGRQFCRPFDGALPMLGVTPATIPEIEASYEALLDELNAHFSRHPFLLGERASIGDFGMMGPMYAHLGRDFYPLALMKRRAPQVHAWVERMNRVDPQVGDFLPNDEVPDTLLPVLRRLFTEYFPVLRDTVQRLDSWIEKNPERRIPRVIGRHRFRLGAVEEERMIFPYAQWMLQRPLDHLESLKHADRAAVDAMLAEAGGEQALRIDIRHRLKRDNNRLVVDRA